MKCNARQESEKEQTDSSVEWLNYNTSGLHIYRRERKRRAFDDDATTTNLPREKKKEHDREKKKKIKKKGDFLRERFISVFLSLLLNGDSSSFFISYGYRYRRKFVYIQIEIYK